MDVYTYAMALIGGIAVLMMICAWSAQWQMIDARNQLARAKEDAHDWAEKCRHAWERLAKKPSWMEPSGLEVLIGELKPVPIYKPFAVVPATGACVVREGRILKDNQILETFSLASEVSMCDGDELHLFFNVGKQCPNGGESLNLSWDVPSSPSS